VTHCHVGRLMAQPPPLPPDGIHTRCWCEENIYLLAQSFLHNPLIVNDWDVFVVFISNATKTVCLWKQALARAENAFVIWDYHVVLLLRERQGTAAWLYDWDTTLPKPSSLQNYLTQTFALDLLPEYRSQFRIIPGTVYLDNFASSRSHMLRDIQDDETGMLIYMSPPPEYPPLAGAKARERGITNNLMESFVRMDARPAATGDKLYSGLAEDSFGVVIDLDEFMAMLLVV